jgi:hypothetical protein
MLDSECSVVVGDQRALLGGVDEPVVPDAGREGEQALSDSGGDARAPLTYRPQGWWTTDGPGSGGTTAV